MTTRPTLQRRRLTRSAFLAAAGLATGPTLMASGSSRAAASAVRTKIKLIAEVSWQGATNYPGMPKSLTDEYIRRNWSSKHPGVEVETLGWRGDPAFLNGSAAVASALAGVGPDIFMTCCDGVPTLIDSNVLAPIEPLLKRDNIDVTKLFPTGLLADLTGDQGLLGLPDYGSTGPFFVNLSMLDDLGLRYPEPDWTYQDAERLWRAVAGVRKGQRVYGAAFVFYGSDQEWLSHAWGGSVYDATRTRSLLDSDQNIKAYQWLMTLMADNVVYPGQLYGDGPISSGQAAFSVGCCGTLQSAVLRLGTRIKWDVHPVPAFPNGNANFDGIGIYGMNALSKNPQELVWSLYKFITMDPGWQRFFNARLAFMPPSLLSSELWDDWAQIVRTMAPLLRTKHIEYYAQALPFAYNRAYFRYQPLQAEQIMIKYTGLMQTGKQSVVEALRRATDEINALEAAGARVAAANARSLSRTQALIAAAAGSRAPVTFPAPPRAGVGAPSKPATGLVKVTTSAVTVTGTGSMAGGARDDGTFACAAATTSQATYACRITGIAALGGQVLHGGAKVGLMVRGDLSDNAPMVFVDIDGPRGLHTDMRPLSGLSAAHQHILGGDTLVRGGSTPVPNWLLKPLWLRWVRTNTTWVAYTSWDGGTWRQAGTPIEGIEMAGCWVGLFVCSNNAPHAVQAVFDHVTGFVPDTFVVLGG